MKKIIWMIGTFGLACFFMAGVASWAEATEFRLKVTSKGNTKIDFPYGTVNGATFWSQAEYNQAVTEASVVFGTTTFIPPVTTLITPTQLELTVASGTLTGFATADDFRQALTQDGLQPYVDDLWVRWNNHAAAAQNNKRDKVKANWDYFISVIKSLP